MDITISPLDSRYLSKVKNVKNYFSEFSFFKYRVLVEIEYFISLCKLKLKEIQLDNMDENVVKLRNIYNKFSINDYNKIKDIENKINHDVKSIEYWLREKFKELNLGHLIQFIHFGLTSQDINNTALSLSIKNYINDEYKVYINELIYILNEKIVEWKDIVMISHTHGQPAVPTKMGKEMNVFKYRLELQLEQLDNIKYYGKFGGASGNLNAHNFVYPDTDWITFGEKFIERLGLIRSKYTTQIDNYDNLSNIFDCLKRINTICIDMCQDIWLYISMRYFNQIVNNEEVGSSTMPHKINPIYFENAEGNLGYVNSILEFFSRKLPISRLQRDLTDSTVLRNIGVVFGHIQLSVTNINKGLNKLLINKERIQTDLDDNYVVVTEGIQVLMKKYGYTDAYEQLKELSRKTNIINKDIIQLFISTLGKDNKLNNEIKKKIIRIKC